MKKKISKKKFLEKKGVLGVTVHKEGNYFCDCLIRGYRKWLGVKRYGKNPPKDSSREDEEPGSQSGPEG